MKKIVIFLLTCLLFIHSYVVYAANAESIIINEDFSIRNGITLHSSVSDIKNVESANTSISGAYFSESVHADLAYTVFVAGHAAELYYWTDTCDMVEQLQYMVATSEATTELRSSLTKKYGSPNYNYNDLSTLSTKISAIYTGVAHMDPTVTAYDGWLIQYNDCWVLVEFCQLYITQVGTVSSVNYCILSPEEAQSHFERQGAIENSIQQSVNSDL